MLIKMKVSSNYSSTLYFIFFLFVAFFLFSSKSFATSASLYGSGVPQYYPASLQSYFTQYDTTSSSNCIPTSNNLSQNPAVSSWISVRQNRTANNVNYNYWTNDTYSISTSSPNGVKVTIPLQLNLAYLVCHITINNGAKYNMNDAPNYNDGSVVGSITQQGQLVVVSAIAENTNGTILPGNFTGISSSQYPGAGIGQSTDLILPAKLSTKYWLAYNPFSFTPSNPINHNFKIVYKFIALNYFGGKNLSDAWCVEPAGLTVKANPSINYYGCYVNTSTATVIIKITRHPPPSDMSCPGFPNYKDIVVGMPYTGPSSPAQSSTSSQSAADPAPSIYTQYTPQGVKETSISDVSIGGLSVMPKIVPNSENDGSPGSTSSASGSIALDYSPYVLDYPYDFNQAQVNYNNLYQYTLWFPSFIGNSCSAGDTLSGITCSGTRTVTFSWSYTVTPPSGCNPGATASVGLNGTINCSVTFSWTYNVSYTATANYSWSPSSAMNGSSPTSNVAQQMTPCYDRIFMLDPINNSSAILSRNSSPNYENPNLAQMLLPLQYQFDIPPSDPTPNDGFRMPSQLVGVNVAYQTSQWHQYADGSTSTINPYLCNSNQGTSPFTDMGGGQSNIQTLNLSCGIVSDDDNTNDFVAGDYAEFNGTVNYQSGNLIEQSAYGNFLPTQTINTTFGPSDSNRVHTKPYIKVNGGDIITSIDVQNSGGCIGNSSINSWNQGNSPSYNGSGTTLAVITGGYDNGFASNQNSLNTPSGLVFSNDPINGGYGGNFCGTASLPPVQASSTTNYVYNQLNALYPTSSYNQNCISTLPINSTCVYNYGSSTVNIPSLNIVSGGHVVIFGSGPVNINGNIILNTASIGVNYSNPLYIPSLEIVTNNAPINIANNVTELDGVYIAGNSTINDCMISGAAPTQSNMFNDVRRSDLANSCGIQLVINGALEASQINFYRTYDSLYEAGNNDNDSISNGSTTNQSSAAEIINYSPLVWLSPNNLTGLYTAQQTPIVQSITSLAPIVSQP